MQQLQYFMKALKNWGQKILKLSLSGKFLLRVENISRPNLKKNKS